jgi:hypothetical protein
MVRHNSTYLGAAFLSFTSRPNMHILVSSMSRSSACEARNPTGRTTLAPDQSPARHSRKTTERTGRLADLQICRLTVHPEFVSKH